MTAEHKMPIDWQRRHIRATVSAGLAMYHAQSPFLFATAKDTPDIDQANQDADAIDRMFSMCPMHQWGALAQGVNNYRNALIAKEEQDQ